MSVQSSNLIWLDLEMTGLNPDQDRIIEIATIITNSDLHIIAEGPSLAIHQPDEILGKMDAWNRKQHGSSGLVERVKTSTVTENDAELETLSFLQQYVPAGKSPLCGNSVYQDRRFLYLYMPQLEKYFHYRLLDVSTLKILAQRWAPQIASSFQKESKHLALDDVRDSIAELKHYRENWLR